MASTVRGAWTVAWRGVDVGCATCVATTAVAMGARKALVRALHVRPDFMFAPASAAASFTATTSDMTELVGRSFGRRAHRGDVILLEGGLGVGKTAFARGFVRGACHDDGLEVTSPTFLLDNSYVAPAAAATAAVLRAGHGDVGGGDGGAGRDGVAVHHMDMYRLQAADDASVLGLQHVFTNGISVIEWPDRIASLLPAHHLLIRITLLPRPPPAATRGGGSQVMTMQGMPLHHGAASMASTHATADPTRLGDGGRADGNDATDQGGGTGEGEDDVDDVDDIPRRIDVYPRGDRYVQLVKEVVKVMGTAVAAVLPHGDDAVAQGASPVPPRR